jgi:hypothetical protein
MRQVIHGLGDWVPQFVEKRKQPLYYHHVDFDLVVLGHYGSPCGGCDTIGSARAVYELIQQIDAKVILCEGLLLSEDTLWSSQLANLRVLFLTTPIQQCLTWIGDRRIAAGNVKPLNPNNTVNRVATIERARQKLVKLGVPCRRASAKQAPEIVLKWVKEICQK